MHINKINLLIFPFATFFCLFVCFQLRVQSSVAVLICEMIKTLLILNTQHSIGITHCSMAVDWQISFLSQTQFVEQVQKKYGRTFVNDLLNYDLKYSNLLNLYEHVCVFTWCLSIVEWQQIINRSIQFVQLFYAYKNMNRLLFDEINCNLY